MKKIILSIAILAITQVSKAQDSSYGFTKGNKFIEGSLQVSSSTNNNSDTKSSLFAGSPKLGYFISDKFALGATVGYNTRKTVTSILDDYYTKSNIFTAKIFGRYYFLEVGKRFKTFTELETGYQNIKYSSNPAPASNMLNLNGFVSDLNIGFNYFLSPKIAINYSLSSILSYSSDKIKDGKSINEFDTNLNIFNNFFNTSTFGLTFKF